MIAGGTERGPQGVISSDNNSATEHRLEAERCCTERRGLPVVLLPHSEEMEQQLARRLESPCTA